MGSLFSFISDPFESWLGQLAILVGSAGIAIILFTVIIRLILSPLQIIQLRSARAMQRLQPHIADLRKKHGKDRQKLTEETMKLYKEHKVNPAMGCLPLVLQFPVLIGLFWALQGLGKTPHITLVKGSGVWLKHFATCLPGAKVGQTVSVTPDCYDKVNHLTLWSSSTTDSSVLAAFGKSIPSHTQLGSTIADWLHVKLQSGTTGWLLDPAYTWIVNSYHSSLFGASHATHVFDLFHANFLWLNKGLGQPDPLLILPILAGVTQWIQSRMMMQKSSDPQQQSMNLLMNFTPLIIVFFAIRYPSGLSLYWVTSTIIGILISARITGWGTLPRLDRMVLGKQPPPSRRPRTKPAPSKPKTPLADISGADTSADIVDDTDQENEELNGNADVQNGNPVRQRQQSRRRSGRNQQRRRG